MGLLSGLFGIGNKDSTTNTNTTNNYNDNRSVQDASGGGVIGSGQISNSTSSSFDTRDSGNTTITTLDGHAIGLAFDSTNKTVDKAFKFGSDALGFGKDALAFGGDTVDSALSFARQAQTQSQSAISDVFSKALDTSSKQTKTVVDSLNGATHLVETAYADAKGRGAMTDYITMIAIGGALFVAFMATRK